MNKQYRSLFWLGAGAGALLALRAVTKKINAYSFQGKVVIITGGSRGIGLAIARILAEEGARLAICARTAHQLKTASEALTDLGAEVLAVPCDLTDRKQAEAFIQRVKTHYGQVDVLINNAGIIQAGPLEAMALPDFENAMSTHFWAPLYTMLSVIPEMKARGTGRIVNIASVGGKVSVPHIVPYSASKFALVGLSRGFRHELKKDGIKVTTINPGLTRSGSNVNILVKGQAEKEYAWFTTMGSSLLTSSSVENTARQIVEACRYGEAEIVTNLPARLLILANDLFPELTSDILSLSSQYILPDPSDNKSEKTGLESDSKLVPEHLRKRSFKAALENNEF
ncbi:SDR family NAD(P)-dependent oxidoreductase [Adhaeribacter terrigena]|nr:SDR family oxidoreductase [Adhaeribacter terrigena]